MKRGGREERGVNQSLSLEAPFDDTVPLNDILTTSTNTGQLLQHQPPPSRRRLEVMFPSSARGGSDTTNPIAINTSSPYVHVEGQTISVPEPINDAADTAPIVDSDEGRSFESDGTNPTVQVLSSNPISPRRAYFTVAILFAINLLNYMDRYTIAGVLHSVQHFYSIKKSMLGLLQTAFIVSYMLFSPIFGYMGDRYNRKYIMAFGIFFWSCLTLAGSFVDKDKFTLFLFIRALVGIGEATYSTIAPTIIADLFVKDKRSRMLMVFYFAIPVGSGLGYIVGSNVASAVGKWQYALRVTPPLGVICSFLIMIFLVEPERGSSEGGTHLKNTSYLTDIRSLLKNKSFMFSTLGFTCVAFVTGALALWAPYFMYDAIGVLYGSADMAEVSLKFGIITCAAGFLGVAVGSLTAQYYRKINPRADPLICANGMLLCTPFMFFALITMQYSITGSWVLIFIGETLLCLNWAIVADILLYVVLPTRRSLAESFQIIISHMFGDAGSPYLIGLISDKLSPSYPEYMQGSDFLQFITLRSALYITCFVCVLGGGAFFAAALFVEKDKERVDNLLQALKKKKESKPNGVCGHVNEAFSNGESVTAEEPYSVENSRKGGDGGGGDAEEVVVVVSGSGGDTDGDDGGGSGEASQTGSAATSLNSVDVHHIGSLECQEMKMVQSYSNSVCHDDDDEKKARVEKREEEEEEEEGEDTVAMTSQLLAPSPPSLPPLPSTVSSPPPSPCRPTVSPPPPPPSSRTPSSSSPPCPSSSSPPTRPINSPPPPPSSPPPPPPRSPPPAPPTSPSPPPPSSPPPSSPPSLPIC